MIFEKLVLHNFGAYHGEHVIDFAVEPGKPVVLVGALNGSGKTTLLEATQLALFGRAVRSTSRGRMAYLDYLEQLINRNVRPEVGAGVSLTFRHRSGGRDDVFTITRTWHQAGAAIKEHVEVLRNGALDTEATDRWLEFVEEFLPVQLADLFLFDGERIEALADPERSTDFLKTGIHALLGLDLVDHLARTLHKHERDLRTKNTDDSERRLAHDTAEANVAELRRRREQLVNDRAQTQNTADRAQVALDRARQRLVKEGGALYADRDQINAHAALATEKVNRRAAVLRELAAGDAPLLLLGELLAETRTFARGVDEVSAASRIHDVLVRRDAELAALLSKEKMVKATRQRIEAFLEVSRSQWHGHTPIASGISFATSSVDRFPEDSAEQCGVDIAAQLAAFDQEQANSSSADARRDAVPSEESLRKAVDDVREAEGELARCLAVLEVLGTELNRLDAQLERAAGTLERSQKDIRALDLKDEVAARVVRHSLKARDTLSKFRHAVAARNVERLEGLITERFQAIARKRDSLVSRIRVDPTTFQMVLLDKQERSLDPMLLSAGERQLLAVAIVWALANASGRTLPTMIDTPLGRLDGEHRSKLVEEYFPEASHQVILLSTDEEINGKYYARLRPRIAREYLISFDPATRSSRIEPGYFPQDERAVA